MLTSVSSVRSHFLKHVRLFNQTSALFSNFRSQQQSLSRLRQFSGSLSYSTANNEVAATNDSFTSTYLCVRICCPTNVADVLSETLLCFGATSTTVDEQEFKGSSSDEMWISSTFEVGQDVKDCISRAVDSVGLKEIPSYEVEMRAHTDWIKLTQESFNPVEIEDGLWIVPEWRKPPDPQAVNIILNPGLAFGTGEHPTTKLCLMLLRRSIKGGECFLDFGTGSGVLAIAALKFGADLSVGFDIEPQSITSARQNAALNNIGADKYLLSLVPSKDGPEFEHELGQDNLCTKIIARREKFDVVIANILLHPLLDLADRIVSYAKPGATVGLSGIISEQVPSVAERYSKLLENITVSMMDDWACISGTKKSVY